MALPRRRRACLDAKKNCSHQRAHTLREWSARTTKMRKCRPPINQCPVTRNVSPPSRRCPCPGGVKSNPASCPTEPPASCAWSLCSGCTSACLVRASSHEDLLAKTQRSSYSVSSVQNPSPAATRSAWPPANNLFASSLFVKTSVSCLSSHVRSRVMNLWSLCRQSCLALLSSFPRTVSGPPIWQHLCAKLLLTDACLCERLRKKVGQLQKHAIVPTPKTCNS